MSKIGLFFSPAKGNTEKIAKQIADKIGNDKVKLVLVDEKTSVEELDGFDKLIFGISTVGRESWDAEYTKIGWDFYMPKLEKANLKGKTVALFGLGNHILYAQYFVDAMGFLGKVIMKQGGKLVGFVDKSNYDFKHSEAVIDNKFIGLPIDEDTQEEFTEDRINKWLVEIKELLNF